MPIASVHRRRAPAVLLVGTAATAACSHPAVMSRGERQDGPSALVCAVVEAAVDSLIPRSVGLRLALADSTHPVRQAAVLADYWAALRKAPGLDSTTWASFVASNRARRPACAALPSGAEVVLVRDSDRQALRAASGNPDAYWQTFYARFPRTRGLTTVSGVGLSADGRQALLALDHGCGGLCGHGHVLLLTRAPGGRWHVRHVRMTWVS